MFVLCSYVVASHSTVSVITTATSYGGGSVVADSWDGGPCDARGSGDALFDVKGGSFVVGVFVFGSISTSVGGPLDRIGCDVCRLCGLWCKLWSNVSI